MKEEKKITLDAREYAQIADDYIDDYLETGYDEYIKKGVGVLTCQIAIASALADIRDELRIMNERSNDNGKT